MRILGIDPGLATIGIGLVEASSPREVRALDWLTIETQAGAPAQERLAEIHRDLRAYVREARPERAVVEKLFFATNERTALDVAQARGIILLTLAEEEIPTLEPTPLELKAAITGDGGADKRQMQDMLKILLHLQDIPKPDDAADALALAVFGALQPNHLQQFSAGRHPARPRPGQALGNKRTATVNARQT